MWLCYSVSIVRPFDLLFLFLVVVVLLLGFSQTRRHSSGTGPATNAEFNLGSQTTSRAKMRICSNQRSNNLTFFLHALFVSFSHLGNMRRPRNPCSHNTRRTQLHKRERVILNVLCDGDQDVFTGGKTASDNERGGENVLWNTTILFYMVDRTSHVRRFQPRGWSVLRRQLDHVLIAGDGRQKCGVWGGSMREAQ